MTEIYFLIYLFWFIAMQMQMQMQIVLFIAVISIHPSTMEANGIWFDLVCGGLFNAKQ